MERREIISDIQDFLTGVDEELRSFIANFDADIPRKCVSNLYYAYFHAVRALLATRGIYPKTHEGTERMFALHFIKSKVMDGKFGIYFSNLHSRREDADYKKHIPFTMEWTRGMHQWVSEFIPEVLAYIKREYPEINTSPVEVSFKRFTERFSTS